MVPAKRPAPYDPLARTAVVFADVDRSTSHTSIAESLEMRLDAVGIEAHARIKHDGSRVDLTRGREKLVIQACSHEGLGADRHGSQKRRPNDDTQDDPGIALCPYPLHDAHAGLQSLRADAVPTRLDAIPFPIVVRTPSPPLSALTPMVRHSRSALAALMHSGGRSWLSQTPV